MTDHNNNADDGDSPRDVERENDPPELYFGEIFYTTYGDDESPWKAIVRAVSAVEGVQSTDVEPLYESVDPDALDALMNGPVVIGNSGTIDVEFQYSGYRVHVRNDGTITILEGED